MRTHKLLKNVVYSFHWCEFKLSSAGFVDEGVTKQRSRSISVIVTLESDDDTSKQSDV